MNETNIYDIVRLDYYFRANSINASFNMTSSERYSRHCGILSYSRTSERELLSLLICENL